MGREAHYHELYDDVNHQEDAHEAVSSKRRWTAGAMTIALVCVGAFALTSTFNQEGSVATSASTHEAPVWPASLNLQTASGTCPTVQQGIDYVGNDIGSILGSGASDCCTKCGQRAGCGAFSWTNYNGGTCWLKSGKGSTTAKVGVVSAVISVPVITCPTVQQGVDYTGNDIGNVAGSGASDCCTKCAQRAGCGAFTWSNHNGGTCWLKSAKGATSITTGVVSAVLSSTSTPTPTPPPTTTKPPPTTTKPPPATTAPPPTTTKPPPTTTKPPPATTAPPSTTTSPPPTTTAPAICPTLEKGVNFVGNDIISVAGSGAPDCCTKCNALIGCAAFTWNSHNGGTCWLKSGKGATTTVTGVVSAIVKPKISGGIFGGVPDAAQTNLVDENGVWGNPLTYPSRSCSLPNYISKNGKIYATGPGIQDPIAIKGVNWFGMETSATLPLGLWTNDQNGSTLYSITSFLARNKFNSVRLPICMESLLQNIVPNRNLVNEAENRALKVDNYMNTLKSIIRALGYRGITVLISLHTLTTSDPGMLWYSGKISEQAYLQGVDMLTKNLCSNEYFNVIGLDLKNEPAGATWGDGSAKDFRAGAVRIGERMLQGCSNWLAFVEGNSESRTWTSSAGRTYYFSDWWGGGLVKAKQFPVTLSTANKVVYAPHYYSPAVYPTGYYYGDGFTELSDASLKENIRGTFDMMFGYLAQGATGPAVVLGEFGGLYSLDRHPQKTLQRTINYTIELLMRPGFSGGYMWSLNPESGYDYNPGNTKGFFQEGLLQANWRAANEPFLGAFTVMDKMADLKPLPCYKW